MSAMKDLLEYVELAEEKAGHGVQPEPANIQPLNKGMSLFSLAEDRVRIRNQNYAAQVKARYAIDKFHEELRARALTWKDLAEDTRIKTSRTITIRLHPERMYLGELFTICGWLGIDRSTLLREMEEVVR